MSEALFCHSNFAGANNAQLLASLKAAQQQQQAQAAETAGLLQLADMEALLRRNGNGGQYQMGSSGQMNVSDLQAQLLLSQMQQQGQMGGQMGPRRGDVQGLNMRGMLSNGMGGSGLNLRGQLGSDSDSPTYLPNGQAPDRQYLDRYNDALSGIRGSQVENQTPDPPPPLPTPHLALFFPMDASAKIHGHQEIVTVMSIF